MNTTIGTLMFLALFATGASAQESSACKSNLSMTDVAAAMGAGVTFQPVFAGAGIRGWRLYGTRNSAQLTRAGVNPGALMTHVCGVPADEIRARDHQICCNVDTTCEFEVTIKFPDLDWKVVIKRPMKTKA
jgi:hypothetical protein